MAKILVIEDEENLRFSIRKGLERAGHSVAEADAIAPARAQMERDEPDLVLTDVNLVGHDNGLDLIERLRDEGYGGAIVVVTAYGSVENAVQAMKRGADEYLQKPLSLEELQVIVGRALENRRVRSRLNLYERMERTLGGTQEALGESRAWKEVVRMAERLARADFGTGKDLSAVLLLGETGSGKGVLARHMHSLADSASPFVHVNCSALPATLIESELFGHEKGAFTDARENRAGLFELAEGGTIFLDEIGDLPLELQSKLLIVVEQGTYRRLGGSKERRAHARVIAATNHDLARQVEAGRFRADLYYRLNALTITIPPLREREGDALLIARSLLKVAARKLHRPNLTLSEAAEQAIAAHHWPGNVRELANAIQRAALLATGDRIRVEDLALNAAPSARAGALQGAGAAPASVDDLRFNFDAGEFTAEAVEKHLIVSALRHARGNVSKAAKLIGMNRSSLRYRLERYDLERFAQELATR